MKSKPQSDQSPAGESIREPDPALENKTLWETPALVHLTGPAAEGKSSVSPAETTTGMILIGPS